MSTTVKANELFDVSQLSKDLAELLGFLKANDTALKDLTESLQTSNKTIQDNAKNSDTLNKAKKNVTDADKESARIQREAIKIQKDATTAANEEAGTLERLRAANRNLIKEKEKLVLTNDGAKKRQKEINDELNKNNKLIFQNSDALTKQRMNIGNYQSALTNLSPAFGGAVNGAMSFVKSLWMIVMNPIGLIIAAIVGALVALYKAFTSTDSGAKKLAQVMEVVSAVIDVVRQRIASFAKGLIEIFKGNWAEAGKLMAATFSNIGDQIKAAAKAGWDYQDTLDKIADAESNYISRRADIKNKIAKLEFLSVDKSKTIAERKAALEEALRLGKEEAEVNKKIAKEKLDNELMYLAGKSDSNHKVTAEQILEFTKMSDEEQANASESLQLWRENNEAKAKEVEELYAKYIEADTAYFEENKRNNSKLTAFDEQIAAEKKKRHDAEIKGTKEANDLMVEYSNKQRAIVQSETERLLKLEKDKIEAAKQAKDTKIAILEEQYLSEASLESEAYTQKVINGEATVEDAFNYSQKLLEINRSRIDELMSLEDEGSAAYNDLAMQRDELDRQIHENALARKKDLWNQSLQFASQVTSSIAQIVNNGYEQDLINNNKERQEWLKTYGKTEADKQKINEKFDKEEAKIKKKQFEADKKAKLIEVAIQTAMNVVKVFPNPLLMALAGVVGALQASVILSQPVPAFKDGVKDFSGGLAIVGDGGMNELIKTPDNKWYLSPDTSTMVNLPKGSQVFSGSETQQALQSNINIEKFNELISEERNTQKAIKNIKVVTNQLNITEGGINKIQLEANSTITHANKYFR